MIYFFKKNWLISITIISVFLNIIAFYFLYQESKTTDINHEKSYIKQPPLDYETFKNQWGEAWLGLEVGSVTPEVAARVMIDRPEGALVEGVVNGSPAQKADIAVGDVILSFNGRKIRTPKQFENDLSGSEIGSEVYMCVAKRDYRVTVYAVPEERPPYLYPLYPATNAFPFLGVNVCEVLFGSDEAEKLEEMGKAGGVLVEEVVRDSPAEKAGLQEGDIIMSFNNRKTRTLREFLSDLAGTQAGGQVRMCIVSGDVRKTIYVVLENTPVSREI